MTSPRNPLLDSPVRQRRVVDVLPLRPSRLSGPGPVRPTTTTPTAVSSARPIPPAGPIPASTRTAACPRRPLPASRRPISSPGRPVPAASRPIPSSLAQPLPPSAGRLRAAATLRGRPAAPGVRSAAAARGASAGSIWCSTTRIRPPVWRASVRSSRRRSSDTP